MATTRGYDVSNISVDTGAVEWINFGQPASGEAITPLWLRVRTNTVDASGQYLVTVEWFDGNQTQQWNVAYIDTFQPFAPGSTGYLSSTLEAWVDFSVNPTIRVQPTVAGGSIDVVMLYSLS